MNMFKHKNTPLIIAFSIPILMILFVVVSIYIPGLFVQPKYNFLYSTGEDYYGNRQYSVIGGRLIINPTPTPSLNYRSYGNPQLYVHNVMTNESMPVSFEDGSHYFLDSNTESPDGYKLENGSSGGGFFPFWYDRDYGSKYLVGHNVSKKVNVRSHSSSYNSIHFLGWIMQ